MEAMDIWKGVKDIYVSQSFSDGKKGEIYNIFCQ